MKIVILDGYTCNPGDLSWDKMKEFGEVVVYDRTAKEDTITRIADAEVVITNKTLINKEVLEACKSIKFIVVLAAGYDVVDFKNAKELGIKVSNCPAYGSKGVAQMAFAHILEITNNVGAHCQSVKEGQWVTNDDWCYWKKPIIDLNGKKLGIIGYGNIGREVAAIARAFSMEVLAYDVFADITDAKKCTLDEIFANADIITLHCPFTPETKHLICKENIAKMKKGIIIINASRGPLVNESELTDAVKSGHVYACGVDVITLEPPTEMTDYLKCENINVTPHIAWASVDSRSNIINIAYGNIKAYTNGEDKNVVNK